MQNYDLLFLPTAGENYGHVVVEALSAGVPVLLSDQTPWRCLQEKGIGWDIPLSDTNRFVEAIQFAAKASSQEWVVWKERAVEHAAYLLSDPVTEEANRTLFSKARQQ
jgi:glycosyltransferase involved in cell wall biosynthesis